ncbi:arylamine N-acetyltransferase family protein [Nonomuraea basaltis]|uniref:arylamine N-acetyltransferase family protein n=1 Tax=Nonomuraea basaltis TaxID=2495887 RepID=UPI00110C4793|nr:arylamine N-acetyltransferase [Nonomuraea basaltis]TMR98500.1 arylamine N-acetyltransferase [Nonomuraea basaltis]
MTWDIEKLDLDAYLSRIGYDGPPAPTLRAVHLAHVQAIPFENLDVLLDRGNRLDLGSLQDKLVTGGRGGYCHEQNLLFAAALERLGFTAKRHLARIRLGRYHLPRSHATLTVTADGRTWLADVGFGGEGLVEPMPFEEDATLESGEWRWRLGRDGDFWVLHSGETELYAFRPDEPHYPSDFEVANFFVSEYPQSPFRHHVLVQRTTAGTRIRLEDLPVATVEELVASLRDRLGIEITQEDAQAVLPKLAN